MTGPTPTPYTSPEPTPYTAPAATPYNAAPYNGAPAAKWNVLSIVSIVTAVIGISLAGIITGHISLSQIKRTGEQGRVLAIIGLVLGYLGLVIGAILIIFWIGIFIAAGATGNLNTY